MLVYRTVTLRILLTTIHLYKIIYFGGSERQCGAECLRLVSYLKIAPLSRWVASFTQKTVVVTRNQWTSSLDED